MREQVPNLSDTTSRHRSRNPGGLLSFREAAQAGVIERGVQRLVEALNVDGLCETISSCEGHGRPSRFLRGASSDQEPFVLFFADERLCQAIAVELNYGRGRAEELHFCWRLQAYYYPSDFKRLAWCIEPDDWRIKRQWERGLIDRDLHALATIIFRAALSIDLSEPRSGM